MSPAAFPSSILEKAATITGKRSRLVVDLILSRGFVTTEDLKDAGYDHPPRAIKDVTDQGLPIVRSRTLSREGRSIASYTFGDPAEIRHDRLGGRSVFPKNFKKQLVDVQGERCHICTARLSAINLQIDHRIPYEIAGDLDSTNTQFYMLVCGTCNRAKSWSCEHCSNYLATKDAGVCRTCYWTSPEAYAHVAEAPVRRLDVTWDQAEVVDFDTLQARAASMGLPLPDYVKQALRRPLDEP